MADKTFQLVVDAQYKGQGAIKQASADVKNLQGESKKTGAALAGIKGAIVGAGAVAAFGALAGAARGAWSVLKEGAALQDLTEDFHALAESAGMAGSSLLTGMTAASGGLMTQAEQMAAASQLITLNLGLTQKQITDLIGASAELGVSMGSVINTINTQSARGYKELGLGIDDVQARMKALMATGMSTEQANFVAVLDAMNAKIDIVGKTSETAEGKMLALGVSFGVAGEQAKLLALTLFEAIGGIEALAGAGSAFTELTDFITLSQQAAAAGVDPWLIIDAGLTRMNGSLAEGRLMLLDAISAINGVGAAAGPAAASLATAATWTRAFGAEASSADAALLAFAGVIRDTGGAMQDGASAAYVWGDAVARAIGIAKGMQFGRSNGAGTMAYMYAEQMGGWNGVTGAIQATEDAVISFGGSGAAAIDHVAEARSRLANAFSQEIGMDAAEGLINADGLVNMEAVNAALYEQAEAAGATAGQLALLGVATGQFSEEQAVAALKAAILMEKISQVARAVATGDIDFGAAIGEIGAVQVQLDSGALGEAQGGLDGLVQTAEGFANETYSATVDAETSAANTAIGEVKTALNYLVNHPWVVNVQVNTNGVPEEEDDKKAGGGPVRGGTAYTVGEAGPELFVPWTSGSIIPNHRLGSGSGGAAITVNNYFDRDSTASEVKSATNDMARRLALLMRNEGVMA